MSQEMMDKTCRGFAEALAAREPVPGGGSASAFVGALGASLCGMVARYGATNPALADRADDLTRAFAQADELAQELVELVAEDVRAYGQVSAAYGIPRDDPGSSDRDSGCAACGGHATVSDHGCLRPRAGAARGHGR